MNIVILGASRGMGRALARVRAERGDSLVLLGRDLEDLERSAADLRVRGNVTVSVAHCDLDAPESFGAAIDGAWNALGRVDTVVVTAALFATQDALEADTDFARRLLTVNLANTVAFCELARKRLLAQGGGTLCVFSSVAGDRGRKPVGIYGASKAGLSHYLEALDHKWRASGLVTICVKPGFVKTGMTAGLRPPPFAGEPDQVARQVSDAIDRGTPLLYTPAMWRAVMLVIRHLPRFVMRRINF
jgi:decaprenylphospho-beta-D-erythro-pentofuranosid-2-ulose 2-reductase